MRIYSSRVLKSVCERIQYLLYKCSFYMLCVCEMYGRILNQAHKKNAEAGGGFHETIQHIFVKFGTVSTLKLSEFML